MSCSEKDGPHTHLPDGECVRKCKECGQFVGIAQEHHHKFRCRDCGAEWAD